VPYARALVERRRGQVPEVLREAADSSLEASNDSERLAGWVRRFLQA
jgi:hypothetical protein